jgi:hypothetical protein
VTDTATEIAWKMMMYKAKRDEAVIRRMMGQWVSELEPSVAYQHGNVVGLCGADDPFGRVYVHADPFRPMVKEFFGRIASQVLPGWDASEIEIQWWTPGSDF